MLHPSRLVIRRLRQVLVQAGGYSIIAITHHHPLSFFHLRAIQSNPSDSSLTGLIAEPTSLSHAPSINYKFPPSKPPPKPSPKNTTQPRAFSEGTNMVSEYAKPFLNSTASFAAQAAGWAANNPGLAATGAVVAFPSLMVTPALSAAGFGAAGVKACSLAAGAHSVIGNIAAGSVFATMQSAGAGGAGLAALNGATQVGAAAVWMAGNANATVAWARSRL
ncbi:hypothetical protein ASPSYDRAFT_67485 [Aspergillus sydowii CBS 593.65]|uniref:Uncharacterized protein n=1 Tax=Aspergillus sydowii CBS 593.65 TaxID=1036612 RepID=A0A1L9TIR3_9EURO|nr:uncharacterized protein ASPSYDRAFT_67485 [Aspergillus sydowii CBS 593.65]OJJ59324.1 hypothetical protein ASPSYDRAFT_67485 [Aspergillus sydowii CBS 593.65]